MGQQENRCTGGVREKNRFAFGVRTPRVAQAVDNPKLSAHITSRMEVGFIVTRKEQGRACVGTGSGTAPRQPQGDVGCRLHTVVAKELRRICEMST